MTKTERELDRRAEPRIKASLPVLLKTPNAHPMEAGLLDVSTSGAHLRIPAAIPVGAPVRIEAEELLLFGTITRCGINHGAYEVGIALSVPLEMLGELQKLSAALC